MAAGIISNENKQISKRSLIPNVQWGTEHLTDDEQDIIRYTDNIIEDGYRILKRLEKDMPISQSLWKEWKSYIRAIRQILANIEKENLTN